MGVTYPTVEARLREWTSETPLAGPRRGMGRRDTKGGTPQPPGRGRRVAWAIAGLLANAENVRWRYKHPDGIVAKVRQRAEDDVVRVVATRVAWPDVCSIRRSRRCDR